MAHSMSLAQAIGLTSEARVVVDAKPPHHILHSNRGFYLLTGWKFHVMLKSARRCVRPRMILQALKRCTARHTSRRG